MYRDDDKETSYSVMIILTFFKFAFASDLDNVILTFRFGDSNSCAVFVMLGRRGLVVSS